MSETQIDLKGKTSRTRFTEKTLFKNPSIKPARRISGPIERIGPVSSLDLEKLSLETRSPATTDNIWIFAQDPNNQGLYHCRQYSVQETTTTLDDGVIHFLEARRIPTGVFETPCPEELLEANIEQMIGIESRRGQWDSKRAAVAMAKYSGSNRNIEDVFKLALWQYQNQKATPAQQ